METMRELLEHVEEETQETAVQQLKRHRADMVNDLCGASKQACILVTKLAHQVAEECWHDDSDPESNVVFTLFHLNEDLAANFSVFLFQAADGEAPLCDAQMAINCWISLIEKWEQDEKFLKVRTACLDGTEGKQCNTESDSRVA